jgi:type I restriction enzyme S subunit
MPKGNWTETSLGDIADVIGGGTPSTKKPEYWGGGIPWITTTELTSNDGKSISGSHRTLTELGLREGPAKLVNPGTVLLGTTATIGTVGFVDSPVAFNQQISGLAVKRSSVDPKFLFFLIQFIKPTIQSLASGTSFKRISNSVLKAIQVIIPSLEEQKRIVDLVSSVDAYVDALTQYRDATQKARKAILNELLNAGGEDWTETTLGEVCEFQNGDRGKNYPSEYKRQNHGIPFINAGHLTRGKIDFTEMDYISRDTFDKLGSGKIRPRDILFCLRGSVGKYGFTGDLNEGAIASSLVILRTKASAKIEYLLVYLDSECFKQELQAILTGAAQPNLSVTNLKMVNLDLPTLQEQKRIVDLVSSFDDSVSASDVLIEKARVLRAGLLADLLSGVHEIPESYDQVMGVA